jgi:outer membrane immunogenic protein
MNLCQASLIGALVISSSAFAADLPTAKPAPYLPPPPQQFSWTGFYLGGYAGGTFGSSKLDNVTEPGVFLGNPSSSGFTGGGLLGYNYQFGTFVVGAEGEFGFNGLRGSANYTIGGSPRNVTFDGNYIGRIRGRLGLDVNNNLLFYVAGGVSFAGVSSDVTNTATNFSRSSSGNFTGFNVGVGGEYAFTQNWITRVEYIYDGFGSRSFYYGAPVTPYFDTRSVSWNQNTVRAAIEYKF